MVTRTLKAAWGRVQFLLSIVAMAAFLAGYILSVVAGVFVPDNGGVVLALVIMGLVVGFLNITGREIIPYLVAAIALVLIGNVGEGGAFTSLNDFRGGLGDRINDIVHLMAVFTAPAAVIQAIKAGVVLAKPGEG